MKSWLPRNAEFSDKQKATTTALSQQSLAAGFDAGHEELVANEKPIPKYVLNWLAQLRLLYGVPFEYLVCDEKYLPVESIRFFYIDRNWSDALIDGALSIGTTSRDQLFKNSNIQGITNTLDGFENSVRSGLRGLDQNTGSNSELVSGFLLRSSVVSGYPGMEVRGYADKKGSQLLDILRLERLSPDILLCLFAGKPADVALQQPPEGLHFGVRKDENNNSYYVYLRNISGDDVGMQILPEKRAAAEFRAGADGVLDVSKTVQNIATNLSVEKLPSSAFAIQMIRASGLQQFTTGVPPKNNQDNSHD